MTTMSDTERDLMKTKEGRLHLVKEWLTTQSHETRIECRQYLTVALLARIKTRKGMKVWLKHYQKPWHDKFLASLSEKELEEYNKKEEILQQLDAYHKKNIIVCSGLILAVVAFILFFIFTYLRP